MGVSLPSLDDGDGGDKHYILLMKDQKLICRTKCHNPPVKMPHDLKIFEMIRASKVQFVLGLPSFALFPAGQCSRDEKEWIIFLNYLKDKNMVAVLKYGSSDFYILPPDQDANFSKVMVGYRMENSHVNDHQEFPNLLTSKENTLTSKQHRVTRPTLRTGTASFPLHMAEEFAERSVTRQDQSYPDHKIPAVVAPDVLESRSETSGRPQINLKQNAHCQNNYARADPSYLNTLGHVHSGWIFGAVAELVDNSKDAKATRLDIFVENIYLTTACKDTPLLSVIDDGIGMTHQDIVRMTCFGHRQPDGDDIGRIGRFGIGFKTGAMRLGRDALVLTQTANSRSIAFLSQSLNEGKDNLEIPIVSYCLRGHHMELDTGVQSEALAKSNLKAIKEFSPFNKYLIGEKAALFKESGTGTQVYIWNLEERGSAFCLDWKNGASGGSSFHQGDILISSRRTRSRPGQISLKVPLDYSLRAYLEVIFLDPRMKIYLQGSLVKCRPLARSLKNTVVDNDIFMDKEVQLVLGFSQMEWENANGGIFLYWHGRLIEAYKRVGGMIHNADVGRGVIGVVDVSSLMDGANGHVWVHNNKQSFQDCELYALLEEWLGNKVDEYWDQNFDALQVKKGKGLYTPDHEWAQCDKCRKWRMLTPGFDIKSMPQQWFCYMAPFEESCETPEQKVERGIVTIGTTRTGYDPRIPVACKSNVHIEGDGAAGGKNADDVSSHTVDDKTKATQSTTSKKSKNLIANTEDFRPAQLKRLRRGNPRECKKA